MERYPRVSRCLLSSGRLTCFLLSAQYPLEWVKGVQAKSTGSHKWKVLVDAAAYVHSQPLDLSAVPADFVSISFYKMFGYPTGVGALLIRTENVDLLDKVRQQVGCLHRAGGEGISKNVSNRLFACRIVCWRTVSPPGSAEGGVGAGQAVAASRDLDALILDGAFQNCRCLIAPG